MRWIESSLNRFRQSRPTPSPEFAICWGQFAEAHYETEFRAHSLKLRGSNTFIVIALLALTPLMGVGLDILTLPPPQRNFLIASRLLNFLSIAGVFWLLKRRFAQGRGDHEALSLAYSATVLLGLSFYIITATTYFQVTGSNDRMILLPLFSVLVLAMHPRVATGLWWLAGCFLAALALINFISGLEALASLQELLSLAVVLALGMTANLWHQAQDRLRYFTGVQLARYESELRKAREEQTKAALKALRESNEDWSAMIDASPAIVVIFDSNGIVITCNQSAQDFGFNYGDDFSLKPNPHRHAEFFQPILEDPSANLAHKPFEYWPEGNDSRHLTFFVSRITPRSKTYRTVIAGYDTTETQRLRQQVHRSFQDKTIASMLAGITHDFNNLLMLISGSAEMLAYLQKLPPRATTNIDDILNATQQASSLTRRLLLFAKNRPGAATRLDLNEVIADLMPLLERLKGIQHKLNFVPAPGPAWVKMDVTEVERLAMNLVTNARDALTQPGLIEIGLQNAVDNSVLWVKDNGHGIPKDLQSQIFSPYFTTKSEQGGSGIGLSTVHEIVQNARGRIDVVSSVDQGTTFRIELPRCTSPQAAQLLEVTKAPSLEAYTAIVVESDPKLRRVSGAIVQQLGLKVHLAANAPHALVQSRGIPQVDLLICDLHLSPGRPDLLFEQLRSRHPGVQAIFTTAYHDDLALLIRLQEQGHKILHKPFFSEDLRKLIASQWSPSAPSSSTLAASAGTRSPVD